jgi:prepilin-type N-terminal cleavage/methylation domain-containing protein
MLKSKPTSSQHGFSMIELLVALAVGMILLAMASPLVNTTINTYRLRGAGTEYANLLQRTRMRAVSDDTAYSVYASSTGATVAAWQGMNAFTDINLQGGAFGIYTNAPSSDLGVAFNRSAVALQPRAGAPAVNNLEAQFMPGIPLGVVAINQNDNWSAVGTTVVTFGPRGLPCYYPAVPPAGGGAACSYTTLAPANSPIAYEIFMFNGQIGSWEAVTVNPSGRIREWRYNVQNATWQGLN